MDKKKDPKEDEEKKKPPVPGAVYEEVAKKSRRKKGKTSKDEPTGAGPSSIVPQPSPAQSGYGPGPSVQNPATPTGTTQTPAPSAARQSNQTPKQPTQATSSSARPSQFSVPTGTLQAAQSSSQPGQAISSTRQTNTPGPKISASQNKNGGGPLAKPATAQINPTSGLPIRGLVGSDLAGPDSSTGAQPNKILPGTEGSKEQQSIRDPKNVGSEAGPPEMKHLQHETRPGGQAAVASQGNTVYLSTNYFKLEVKPDILLHRYSITVSPETKGKKLAQMIKDALTLPEFDALRPGIFSDFAAFLLSPKPLPEDLLKVSVPYNKENGARNTGDGKPPNGVDDRNDAEDPIDAENPSDRKRYYVRFGYVRTVDIFNTTNIQESSADQGNLPIVQDLDVVLGHHRKLSPNITMVGKRKAFKVDGDPSAESFALVGGHNVTQCLLIALRGFFSSVRLSTTGILVNINVSHGTFYYERNLQHLFIMIQRHPQVHASKISGLLKGLRVGLTHLLPKKKMVKTVSGYASPGQGSGYEAHPPMVSTFGAGPRDVKFFEYKSTKPTVAPEDKERAKNGRLIAHNFSRCGCDGSYISVYDYFQRKYPSHQISDTMPVVNIGSTQHPSYLPLSACYVFTQPAKLKLTAGETSRMQDFAVRAPYLNAGSIVNDGFPTLGLEAGNRKLATLGINIDPRRVTLEGRVLPQPTVMFRNKNGAYERTSRWNLAGMVFRKTPDLVRWACLDIHSTPQPNQSHKLCMDNFMRVLKDCGIPVSTPDTVHLNQNQLNKLELYFSKWKANIGFLLVVLPNDGPQLYNRIKQLGDIHHGIQTVCVIGSSKKFYNTSFKETSKGKVYRSLQYNANVALKVNIKNGGVNHVLKDSQLGFISEGKTMVVGIDVTHPSPGSGPSAPSVAAMVASSGRDLAQWPAEIRVNPARQEKVDTLRSMLRTHLINWKKKHQSFPEKLLIYRDGVSEGQYQMVLDEELPRLREACEQVYQEQKRPCITLIIVGKRHHTRFYRTMRRTDEIIKTDDGMDGNPPFGTVVDTVIVDQARNWDFYLQSHTALKGTARPAHYFVLLDEIFKTQTLPKGCEHPSDYLYSITHNMCYLFCRATTAVSIPPPVYYADIACERGRRWNSRVFDSSQSEVSGGNELQDDDVKVHDHLKGTMFYI